MILLTGRGSFAQAFTRQFNAVICSFRTAAQEDFRAAIEQASVVIHNSALINSSDMEECLTANFDVTRTVLNLVNEVNPNALFIFLSSMSFLKTSKSHLPILEMTSYAYSKFLAETYCIRHPHPKTVAVRFSTLYYKDPTRDGLSYLTDAALKNEAIMLFNDGKARRDFLPLEVAAQYVFNLCKKVPALKESYNIAAGQSWSFADIAAYLKKRVPHLNIASRQVPNSPFVLSEFEEDDIQKLGRINFSLQRHIDTQIAAMK